jgi:phosphohistidine phosphatase
MFLLFIRHATAAPLGKSAEFDKDRPLTSRGRQRFRQVARSLTQLVVEPKAILTSPLLRARETAGIAANAWGAIRPVVVPALRDGKWPGICRALSAYGKADTVVLVGHEDWISSITARLLGSDKGKAFGYRKGGVALLELETADARNATLLWFIPPRVFRRL